MPTAGVSITGILLQADARGEPLGPLALTFLVRRYAATGAEELRGALERGLTTGLEGLASENRNKAGWIRTLCEAAAVADDERIGDGVMRAARGLCAGWPSRGAIVDAMRDVDACLTAALVLDERGRDVAGAAVDDASCASPTTRGRCCRARCRIPKSRTAASKNTSPRRRRS
jgi:hypothetical protein